LLGVNDPARCSVTGFLVLYSLPFLPTVEIRPLDLVTAPRVTLSSFFFRPFFTFQTSPGLTSTRRSVFGGFFTPASSANITGGWLCPRLRCFAFVEVFSEGQPASAYVSSSDLSPLTYVYLSPDALFEERFTPCFFDAGFSPRPRRHSWLLFTCVIPPTLQRLSEEQGVDIFFGWWTRILVF